MGVLGLSLIHGAGLAIVPGCSSAPSIGKSNDLGGDPAASAGGGVERVVDGGPRVGNGGPQDDACVGIKCAAPTVCSAGQCVPDSTDADHDGFTVVTDCDDHDANVFPGAAEVCNERDDNCNTLIDEGFDQDKDTYFVCAHGSIVADCDDTNPNVNDPGKPARPTTSDLFTPLNSHWSTAGSADINTSVQGWSRLTDRTANVAGALWWNGSYTFDHFELTATIWIQQVTGGSNGMTFAWVPGTSLSAGSSGRGLGVRGLNGYAVAIDTSGTAPQLAILDTTGTALTTTPLPNIRDSAGHALRVVLKGGSVSVGIDGVTYLNGFALRGYVPFAGHWGFTAATGTTGETHYVDDVSMFFPDGQACVP